MGNEESSTSTAISGGGFVGDNAGIMVVKILVVGGAGVGKTWLVKRCVQHPVVDGGKRGVVEGNRLEVSLLSVRGKNDGDVMQLHLWDVPSTETQTGRTPILYTGARLCLIVADITNQSSFDEAALWKKDVDRRNMGLNCALIVSKSDLSTKRASVEAIDGFARKHGFVAWFKTSALENTGLNEVLKYVISSQQQGG